MKVLLTGVGGLGKTTLAHYLANKGVVNSCINEDYDWILSSNPRTSEGKKVLVDRSIEWMNERARKLQAPGESFVMDRGPADILHLWMNWSLVDPHSWQKVFGKVLSMYSNLDLLVLFPVESRRPEEAVPATNESGMKRVTTGYPVLANQAKLYGICYQLCPSEKILVLPCTPTSTEQRASLVQSRLKLLAGSMH